MIMKKLVALFLVLGLVTVTNAALTIGVSDQDRILAPSETATISISGDGQTSPGQFYMGIGTGGPGSLNIDTAVILYGGNSKSLAWIDDQGIADVLGLTNPFLGVELNDVPQTPPPAPLTGTLVDGIVFHCDGQGNVVISLFDGDGNLLDSVVIQQTPEPITLALLGLGGLFIRRK